MDTFFLEDDDYRDLLIIQSSKGSADVVQELNESIEVDDNLFLDVQPNDFTSPVKSVVDGLVASNDYSDISDWEDADKIQPIAAGNSR